MTAQDRTNTRINLILTDQPRRMMPTRRRTVARIQLLTLQRRNTSIFFASLAAILIDWMTTTITIAIITIGMFVPNIIRRPSSNTRGRIIARPATSIRWRMLLLVMMVLMVMLVVVVVIFVTLIRSRMGLLVLSWSSRGGCIRGCY